MKHQYGSFFFITILLVTLSMCKRQGQSDTLNFEGSWYMVSNDSTYNEAFFFTKHMWAYSERSGPVSRMYEVLGDSVRFHSINSKNYLVTLHYKRLSEDEFVLSNKFIYSYYQRLNVQADSAKVFSGNDDKLEQYVEQFRNRSATWSNK